MRSIIVALFLVVNISCRAGGQELADIYSEAGSAAKQARIRSATGPGTPVDAYRMEPRLARILDCELNHSAPPVWSGYSVLAQPILVYREGERAFLLGHPSPPADFIPVAASPYSLAVKQGTLPFGGFIDYSTHYPLNGTDAFAYRYAAGNGANEDESVMEGVQTIVHERFHVFQNAAFKRTGHPAFEPISPTGEKLAMAMLEQQALKAAFSYAGTARSGEYARWFAAIRGARNDSGLAVAEVENYEEQIEGMAAYTDVVFRARVTGDATAMIRRVSGSLDNYPFVDAMNKGRLYATGLAQGLLLDRLAGPGWQARVMSGAPVASILLALYPMNVLERGEMVARAKERFGYASMLAAGNAQVERYRSEIARALSAYNSIEGVELDLEMDETASLDAGQTYALPGGESLHVVIEKFIMDGGRLRISVADRPAISTSLNHFRFHVGAGARIIVDGRPFEVRDGAYEFSTMKITEPGAEAEAKAPGVMKIEMGGKKILLVK